MDNTEKNLPKPIVVDATDPNDQNYNRNDDDNVITTQDKNTDSPTNDRQDTNLKGILSTIAILIIAPLIALTLTVFVFQSYEVDGPSMETTLQDKDRLIVYKLPRTIARITGKNYQPKRGEIIIFTRQDSAEFGSTKSRQIVKRVIALPGERVVVKDGTITVYNDETPEGFDPDEIAPYGKVITTTSGEIDLVVPDDSVFVCGDNRPQSLDSRAFGPVPMKDLIGKLTLRVYPFGKGQKF